MLGEGASRSMPPAQVMASLHKITVRAAFIVFYTCWQSQSFNSISIILLLSHIPSVSKLSTLTLEHDQFATFWPALLSWIFYSNTTQQSLPAPVPISPTAGTTSSPPTPHGLSRRSSMTSLTSTISAGSRTTYTLAHPPPVILPKVNRAKVVLQLHEVRPEGRSRPAFEVVPTACMAPKILRKSSHMIRKTTGYGPDDLVIAHADDYERSSTAAEDNHREDDRPSRPILGAICHSRLSDGNDRTLGTEIYLPNDSVWTCHARIGFYEFQTETSSGPVIARWAARSRSMKRSKELPKSRRRSGELSPGSRRRFIFSVLTENSEQHPKLGDLSSDDLKVRHSYRFPPNSEEYETINTSEQMRSLMIVSSVWVALMEGWSQVVRADPSGRMLLATGRIGSQSSVVMSGTTAATPRPASWDIRTLPSMRQSSLRQAFGTGSPRTSMSSGRSGSQAHKRSVSAGSYHPDRRRTTTIPSLEAEEPRQPLQIPTPVISDEEQDLEDDSDNNTVVHGDRDDGKEPPAPRIEGKEAESAEHEDQRDRQPTSQSNRRNIAVRFLKKLACVKKMFRKRFGKRGKSSHDHG